jgi:hypothetical protein
MSGRGPSGEGSSTSHMAANLPLGSSATQLRWELSRNAAFSSQIGPPNGPPIDGNRDRGLTLGWVTTFVAVDMSNPEPLGGLSPTNQPSPPVARNQMLPTELSP